MRALEANGFEVEGTLTLVQFPNRGGVDWAWSKGYRVESILDVWKDLGRAGAPFLPDEGFGEGIARSGAVPDGLPIAIAARWIADAYLKTGRPPAPATTFDAAYEAPGGVFVASDGAPTTTASLGTASGGSEICRRASARISSSRRFDGSSWLAARSIPATCES